MSLLTNFYQDIQAWIDAGFPQGIFRKDRGVCANLVFWSENEGLSNIAWVELDLEMEDQFKQAGLHALYPFNNGQPAEFSIEFHSGTAYQNPKRLEWIKNHAVSEQPQ